MSFIENFFESIFLTKCLITLSAPPPLRDGIIKLFYFHYSEIPLKDCATNFSINLNAFKPRTFEANQ